MMFRALFAAVALLAALVLSLSDGDRLQAQLDRTAVGELLGDGPVDGFARAVEPRPLVFPADHGAHPRFRNEWWYVTGNLVAADGRRFGVQLTIFRTSLSSAPAARASAWASDQLYMGHLALCDVAGETLHHAERFERGALDLAGATPVRQVRPDAPVEVWLRGWRMTIEGAERPVVRFAASTGDFGVELEMRAAKPLVLNGDRGLSQKGSERGNASYYYSLTRLGATGHVTLGAQRVAVTGACWLDREWSTSALSNGMRGWDWFALQLEDGRELMLYQLRDRRGAPAPTSAGTLVGADGGARHLRRGDFEIEVLGWWDSPRGGRYPARWRLRVPSAGIDVEVVPRLADQELTDALVRYWEGSVSVRGTTPGQGYVELVGYDR